MTATTSSTSSIRREQLPFSSTFDTVTSVLAAGAMALLGIVAVSLAVAFPLVVSLAEAGRITISAGDLAASRSLAGVAWLFGLVALVHLAAAAATLTGLRAIRLAGFVAAGIGAAIAGAAAVILLRSGGAGAVDGAAILSIVAAAYLYVLGVIAIGRRTA
jgi:hypothetical protein